MKPFSSLGTHITPAKFQPFCMKDPLVSDFALTLASEPDLLLLALRNGYRVDPMVVLAYSPLPTSAHTLVAS